VLIIQGADDPGVPASQAREMAAALKAAGKRHECVIYPGEGHYFAGADAIIDTAQRIERFLAKELGAGGD
jgi:dipeptidyl aminopeptidase/acylaminoacyl peptidase